MPKDLVQDLMDIIRTYDPTIGPFTELRQMCLHHKPASRVMMERAIQDWIQSEQAQLVASLERWEVDRRIRGLVGVHDNLISAARLSDSTLTDTLIMYAAILAVTGPWGEEVWNKVSRTVMAHRQSTTEKELSRR